MILTDREGRPFKRPQRKDFADTVTWLRACWAYFDAISNAANIAFQAQFLDSLQHSYAERNRRQALKHRHDATATRMRRASERIDRLLADPTRYK